MYCCYFLYAYILLTLCLSNSNAVLINAIFLEGQGQSDSKLPNLDITLSSWYLYVETSQTKFYLESSTESDRKFGLQHQGSRVDDGLPSLVKSEQGSAQFEEERQHYWKCLGGEATGRCIFNINLGICCSSLSITHVVGQFRVKA